MNKYFLALLPPPKITADITAIKEELKIGFGFQHALKITPHLTIVPPFTCNDEAIEALISSISAKKFNLFSIKLSGFEAFHPRVIFIDIERNKQLSAFQKEVNQLFVAQKIKKNNGEKHAFLPHITIANKDLSNKTFKQIFPLFKKRAYSSNFEVQSISLLKYNGTVWQKDREIKF